MVLQGTGRQEEVLQALAVYYDEQERMLRQIKSALTYPSLLMVMMLMVIGVLLVKVLPVFDDVYASLGGSLTGMAGGLLCLGQGLKACLPILGVLLAAATVVVFLFSQHTAMRTRLLSWWRSHYGNKESAVIEQTIGL